MLLAAKYSATCCKMQGYMQQIAELFVAVKVSFCGCVSWIGWKGAFKGEKMADAL